MSGTVHLDAEAPGSIGDYWCFISYRHANNREEGRQWATWLHQALEAYEVPVDLIGTANERGERIPERIFPVFRDEEELTTGLLTERIYAALDQSKVLIVLCSPQAAASPYVDQEIRYFKNARGTRVSGQAVHAAIIQGDPNGTEPGSQCFPEALRHEIHDGAVLTGRPIAPLAADLRLADGAEGWTSPEGYRRALKALTPNLGAIEVDRLVTGYRERLASGLLRLIAGVLGVPYRKLTERDKAYQLKRARIAAARQSLQLATARHDQDPIGALKDSLDALGVLETDDPEALGTAPDIVAAIAGTGRLGRIGENVQEIYPTSDGKSLLIIHGSRLAEVIRLKDLARRAWLGEVDEVSKPWGPDAQWRTLTAPYRQVLVDMRTGKRGLRPFPHMRTIVPPPRSEYWQPLASYNQAQAWCSSGFGVCYITSINDDDEWAAVDSHSEELDFAAGTVKSVSDIYEFSANDGSPYPCMLLRGNAGWSIHSRAGVTELENYSSHSFSPGGRYVLVWEGAALAVYSCENGQLEWKLAKAPRLGRAAMSSDDGWLLLVSDRRCRAIAAGDWQTCATLVGNYHGIETVRPVTAVAASWLLSGPTAIEMIVHSNRSLVRNIEQIDAGCRLAGLRNTTRHFVVLATGQVVAIRCAGWVFSDDPAASFFVTLHRRSDDWSAREAGDDRDAAVLRRIDDPEHVIDEVEISRSGYDKGTIECQVARDFVFVTVDAEETNGDPPFQTTYEDETIVLDARTGERIGSLPFVVTSHRGSEDPAVTLTVVRGSTHDRDDRHAVLNNSRRAIIWSTEYDEERVTGVFTSESAHQVAFVVGYARRAAAVHRVADGEKLNDLSGVVVKVRFAPARLPYLVAWYKSGHCELWSMHERRVTRIAELGLVVSAVHFVEGSGRMIVQHADGRAYLLDAAWLTRVRRAGQDAKALIALIRGGRGPAGTPWWDAGHANHHPWNPAPAAATRRGHRRS